jgi:5-methylcytosine-specific restriction endonuclease McrA
VKPSKAKGAKGKADRVYSLLIRSRGRCENCGGTTNLQTAHIIPRRYAAVRTDETNSYCLDARCHMRFTEHAAEWMDFIDRTIGRAEYDRLWAKAQAGVKANEAFWTEEAVRLQLLLNEIEGAA